MNETTPQDDERSSEAATARAEKRGGERIDLRCPNCDHLVLSVPPGHEFKERHLICPGCGLRIEPPDLSEDGGKSIGILGFLKRWLRS